MKKYEIKKMVESIIEKKYANRFPESPYDPTDPVPVETETGLKKPESIDQKIKRLIRTEISQKVHEQGGESFKDANDFDVDEDPEPISGYEYTEMKPEFPQSGSPVSEEERVLRDYKSSLEPKADSEGVEQGSMPSEPHQAESLEQNKTELPQNKESG